MCAMPDRTAVVLVNPIAGTPGRAQTGAHMLARALRRHGWQVDVQVVRGRAAMQAHARAAAEQGCTVVFVAGGDGSYRAAAEGLVGRDTALGPLPLGSRNVLARSVGLTTPRGWAWVRDWEAQAARLARHGRVVQRRDVGRVNGLAFLSWAGVGFDAAIVHRLERARRAPRGQVVWRYAWTVLRMLRGWRGFHAQQPPTPQPQWMWLVFKEPRYAGDLVRLRVPARPDDGRLWWWRVPGQGWQGLARAARAWLSGHWRGHMPEVAPLAWPATWRLAAAQPVHLDGDPLLDATVLTWGLERQAVAVWGLEEV